MIQKKKIVIKAKSQLRYTNNYSNIVSMYLILSSIYVVRNKVENTLFLICR